MPAILAYSLLADPDHWELVQPDLRVIDEVPTEHRRAQYRSEKQAVEQESSDNRAWHSQEILLKSVSKSASGPDTTEREQIETLTPDLKAFLRVPIVTESEMLANWDAPAHASSPSRKP